jgi:superfamily II DNA or RNA helicase
VGDENLLTAKVVVDSRIRVREDNLPVAVRKALRERFVHKNPEWGYKRQLGIPMWDVPKEIATWREYDMGRAERWLSLPRGGMSRVREVLGEAGIDWEVTDRRESGAACVERDLPPSKRELFQHQRDIVTAAQDAQQGIVRAPTGSGKTTALLALASALRVPTLVLVPSVALLKQWIERAHDELGLAPANIGRIQGKIRRPRPLTLATAQTVAKLAPDDGLRKYFGAVMFDEVHLAGAKTFNDSVDGWPARFRIGTSSDHRRKDRKEFLVYDCFGPVIHQVDPKALVASGHVLDVEVRVVPTDFRADWYGMEDENPGSRGELLIGDVDEPVVEKEIDIIRLRKEMAADVDRNRLIFRFAREELAAGAQVLVMAHEREHVMTIGQVLTGLGTPTGYMIGGADFSDQFQNSLARLRAGEMRSAAGTYQAMGTGIDIPSVSVGIAATPIASNRQMVGQVRGRFCRTSTGKAGARMYYLWDRHVFPRHLKNLRQWCARVVVLDGDRWVPAKEWRDAA